jgi:hypothetical protein
MTAESLLKIVFNNTTLLAIFFLIAGSIKLFSYYKLFGIYIYEFIDIKEIITLFVNNLLSYFSVLIFISFELIYYAEFENMKYIIPGIFTILSIIYFLIRRKVFLYEVLILNILFWFFSVIIIRLWSIFDSKKYPEDQIQHYVLLIFLISLIVYSSAISFTEYIKVKVKKYYAKTKITIDDQEFISNNTKYYIGKTEKYLFIYDGLNKSAEVIPMTRIKKIVFI